MLTNKIKVFFAAVLLALICTSAYSAANDLAQRYLDKADEAFDDGNIDDAYKYVNMALSVNKNEAEDAGVLYFAQTIYTKKLEAIKENYNSQDFIEIQSKLDQYPSVANTKIKQLMRQIEQLQTEKKEAEVAARQARQDKATEEKNKQDKAWQESQTEMMNKQAESMSAQVEALKESARVQKEAAEATARGQKELQNALQSGLEGMNESFERSAEATKAAMEEQGKTSKKIMWIIIGIVILILIIVFIAIIIAQKSFKAQEIQQQQYVQAFKMLAANQHQTNRLMLGGVTDLYNGENGTMRLAGNSRWEAAALPDVEQTPEEQEELRNLAAKCEDIGAQIDQVTNRKNNSKNVSELVYKIAMNLGLPQGESMLYFCAAMIYDAGYLGMDTELFTMEDLTDEQRKTLREHVNLAEKHLDFVPKKYWQTFDEAARNHHEHMDGSGYPSGLKGDKIPQVARIIHVCESFISMTSKRGYRTTMDKETAIEKLREQPQFYDSDVIDVLEQIV